MMQGNSEKKRGALVAAATVIVFVGIIIGALVLLLKGEENAGVNGVLAAYIGLLAAVIIGVLVSLKQRFKEITGGEEEEAKKY